MDLAKMSVAELEALVPQIHAELRKRKQDEHAAAREEIMRIAQRVGVPLKDLIGTGFKPNKSIDKKPVAVRYKNPDDSSQTWTGRGRQPRWVKAWEEAGKSLDSLRV